MRGPDPDSDPDSDELPLERALYPTPPHPAASIVFASRVCTRRSEHTARDRSRILASVYSRILVTHTAGSDRLWRGRTAPSASRCRRRTRCQPRRRGGCCSGARSVRALISGGLG